MSFIHVQFAPDFGYEDVVLLAMDTPGVNTFLTALRDAIEHGASRLDHGGITQQICIRDDAAEIKFHDHLVVWHLDRATAVEIDEYLEAFREPDRPGHQYVDIHSPAETLVLSHNEYTPEYFEQLPYELRRARPGEGSTQT